MERADDKHANIRRVAKNVCELGKCFVCVCVFVCEWAIDVL